MREGGSTHSAIAYRCLQHKAKYLRTCPATGFKLLKVKDDAVLGIKKCVDVSWSFHAVYASANWSTAKANLSFDAVWRIILQKKLRAI